MSHAMLINSIVIFRFQHEGPSRIGALLSLAKILNLAPVHKSLSQYLRHGSPEVIEPAGFSGQRFGWRLLSVK